MTFVYDLFPSKFTMLKIETEKINIYSQIPLKKEEQ